VALAAGAAVIVIMKPYGTNVPSPVRGAIALPSPGPPIVIEPTPDDPTPGKDDEKGDVVRSELDVASDHARAEEADQLVASWKESALWGHGFGAVLSSGYERSEDRPWMFEIEPLQILNSVGLLGLLVLGVCVVLLGSVVVRGLQRGSHPVAISAAVAAGGGLLLACLTNPYLQAPAHDWALFLALGLSVAAQREGRATSGAVDPDTQSG
jgi:hypothetical protein